MRATLVERREYLLPEPTKEKEREIRRKVNPIRRPLLFSVSLFFFKKQRVCFVEKHTALDCSQSRTISRRGRNSQFCWRQIKSWISIKLLTCRLCRRLVSAGCWRINRPKTSPLPLRRYGRPRRYFPGVIPFACVCAKAIIVAKATVLFPVYLLADSPVVQSTVFSANL